MATCQHSNIASLLSIAITKEVEEFLSDYVKSFDSKTRKLEKEFVELLIPYFAKQEKAVLKALKGKSKSTSAANKVFDAAFWDELLQETLDPIYNDIILEGGESASTAIKGSFDVLDKEVVKLKRNKIKKIVDVNDTTKASVKRAIQAGVDAGDSIDLIAIRIQSVFDIASNSRAVMIARTEVIGGFNGAAQQAYIQNDIEVNQWLATLDARTRPEHMDSHMQVAKVKNGFDVGGEILMYPGDPNGSAGNVINCRCTTIAIIE